VLLAVAYIEHELLDTAPASSQTLLCPFSYYHINLEHARAFTTATRKFVEWTGYDKKKLPGEYDNAVVHYSEDGAFKVCQDV
jgi:hypothetical protein